MKRLAVLGQPVSHSLSPRMHSAALRELGLGAEWSYEAIELSPEGFAAGVERIRGEGFVGANVTIPHKRAALELADRASAEARAIGAANTLSFGERGVEAANTDAPGLIAALGEPSPAGRRALVLGAGGAARAVVWALVDAGAEVEVWNRTPERARELAAELGAAGAVPAGEPPRPERFEIVVNATAIGLAAGDSEGGGAGAAFKKFGFGADQLSDRQVVVDLVYGETETGLITAAKEAGARTVDGLEVLVRQGAASLAIWTGLSAPLATMRQAVHEARHEPGSDRSPGTSPSGPRTGDGRGDRR